MSHFTKVKTNISDAATLVKALGDIGFNDVELHATPQHLYGYQNDVRKQTAEVIIRRRYVGQASNDIGFARASDGTLTAIISEFDRGYYNADWVAKLSQRYAYHTVMNKLADQGFSIESERAEHGQIKISLSRLG